jgi:Domain of unknown function (DUF4124)
MNRKLLLLALLAACSAQAAEVYKWTDANGIVHYSDAPPPADASQVEKMRVGGGVVSATATPMANDDAAADPDKAKPPAPPAQTALDPNVENMAKLCSQARTNLQMLQSANNVALPNPTDGTPQVMDDQARQARLAAEQQNVAAFCK